MSDVKAVSDDSFEDEVLNSNKPVLVDFWATWCGPCRQLSKVVESIADDREDLKVVKLDIDANPGTASKYGVMSVPTLVLFRDAEVVATSVGAKPKVVLERSLLSAL